MTAALREIKYFLWLRASRIVHGSACNRTVCTLRREVFQNWSHLLNRLFPSFLVTRWCFRSSALRGPNEFWRTSKSRLPRTHIRPLWILYDLF